MGRTEQAYQQLFQVIRDGWDSIGQDVVDTLIRSMDSRVNAVIRANGWYIRY